MVKKIVLWPYLPGQKRLIIDEAVASGRQLLFFNGSREFELIDSEIRQVSGSFEDFEDSVKSEEMHILHTGGNLYKDLTSMLKKRNISYIEKKEIYA